MNVMKRVCLYKFEECGRILKIWRCGRFLEILRAWSCSTDLESVDVA